LGTPLGIFMRFLYRLYSIPLENLCGGWHLMDTKAQR
jgi:hypothetical protein